MLLCSTVNAHCFYGHALTYYESLYKISHVNHVHNIDPTTGYFVLGCSPLENVSLPLEWSRGLPGIVWKAITDADINPLSLWTWKSR